MTRNGSFHTRRRFHACALVGGLAIALLQTRGARAQMQPAPLTAEDRRTTVEAIARLLPESYVFPELGQKAGAAVAAKEKAGAYAQLSDPFAFAEALTRDLQEVTHDRHMRVGPRPPREPGAAPGKEDPKEERRRFAEEARGDHYGFREVKILPGNVGYLRLDGFLPADVAGRTAAAAMNFLSGADAIVFDLRQNGGGDPTMIQLLSSFLFAEPTHLNDLYWRKGERRDQFWTLPFIPGEPMPEVPVYVLTSARTFSAAEEFTNNLKVLKRATIVGETTGGGANPGEGLDAGDRFRIFVPTGRAINPTTGTNWEGTGVEPDVKVAAADALSTAHAAALEALAAKATSPQAAARYRFARLGIEAQLHPYAPPAAKLQEIAGVYGPRQVTLEGGALFYQREGRPKLRMTAVAEDLFQLEGVEGFLARFERDATDRIVKLVGLYDNGNTDESPRNP
jgi:hypothetical protein